MPTTIEVTAEEIDANVAAARAQGPLVCGSAVVDAIHRTLGGRDVIGFVWANEDQISIGGRVMETPRDVAKLIRDLYCGVRVEPFTFTID